MQNKKNQINNLFGKIFSKKKETDLIDRWHYLMTHYGWIPLKEYADLDAKIENKLINLCNELNKSSPRIPKRSK